MKPYIIFIALTFLMMQIFAQTATPPVGTGTTGDPYLVTSLDNLYWIARQVNNSSNVFSDKYFLQTNDIDASETYGWFSDGSGGYYGWIPIGTTVTTSFRGNYNGQNHKIDSLYINRTSIDFVALFGFTWQVTIKNLCVTNADIKGKSRVGSLVGQCSFSNSITNCYSTGKITGFGQYTGGLIGNNDNSPVSQCYSTASVTAYDHRVGGLIGINRDYGIVSNCYATGAVSAPSYGYAGGLIGENIDSGTSVNNCYATGTVSASWSVGGLIGANNSNGKVNKCFWDTETSGTLIGIGSGTTTGATGKTSTQMKTQSTFTDIGWDFIGESTNGTNDYWGMISSCNNGYAFLSWQSFFPNVTTQPCTSVIATAATGNGNITDLGYTNPTQHGVCWNTSEMPTILDSKTEQGVISATGAFTSPITGLTANTKYYVRSYVTNRAGTSYGSEVNFITYAGAGSGTLSDPFQVSTLDQLRMISENAVYWDQYIIQINDIDASSTSTWNPDGVGGYYGWSQIGNNSTSFTGSYNGQGYTINGLYRNKNGGYAGFFGQLDGASIAFLGITNAYVYGGASSEYIGVLVGRSVNNSSSVSNCFVSGSVSGGVSVGGLIGSNEGSTISNCYSRASAYVNDNSGGGLIGTNTGIISNCYSTGAVTGHDFLGGLIGGTSGGTVTDSFWDSQTSGQETSAGGTGKTTNEMNDVDTFTLIATLGLTNAWDFVGNPNNDLENNDYWHINSWNNDGYPILSWQNYSATVTSQAVTNITTTATGNGNITTLGYPNPIQHGVCWNTTGMPTISNSKTQNGPVSATGAFTGNITGLTANTKYYVRSYVTNRAGTSYGVEVSFTTYPGSGTGTSGDPYFVSSLECLSYLTQNSAIWSKYFIQTIDIDASGTQYWDDTDDNTDGNLYNDPNDGTSTGNGEGWPPIGNITTQFTGSYNGQSYRIEGLKISRSSANNIGVFGYTFGGTITNLGVTNANITGKMYVAGIVGFNDDTDLSNCYISGTINATSGRAGGLIGENENSAIVKCYSTATVLSQGNYSGGLIAAAGYSTINNCYATGSVVAGVFSYAGGLVGYISNSTIDKCYSTGTVTGYLYTGGLVGLNTSTVTNSFWDVQTSGKATSSGGTGKTTIQMKTLSTFTLAGWDFIGETLNGTLDIWNIDGTTNSGYPFLMLPDPLLSTPCNLIISFTTNPNLTWNTVSRATSYKVYSSADPYAAFPTGWDLEASGITALTWTDPVTTSTKKFYVVVAVN